MIGPVKGRTPAALAAIAFFAGAGTAQAQFTVEGTYTTGDAPRSVYAARLQRRRPAGRRGVEPGRQHGVGLPAPGPAASRRRAGSPFAAPGTTSNGTVGDFNGDGLPDLAIADFVFGNGVVIALRNPAGGFTRETVPLGGAVERRRRGRLQPRRAHRPRGRHAQRRGNVTVLLRNPGNDGFTVAPSGNYAVRVQPRQIARRGLRRQRAARHRGHQLRLRRTSSVLLNSGDATFAQAEPPTAVGAIAERHHRRRLRRRRPARISRWPTPVTTRSRSCSRSPLGGFTARGRRSRSATRPINVARRRLRRQRHARHRGHGQRRLARRDPLAAPPGSRATRPTTLPGSPTARARGLQRRRPHRRRRHLARREPAERPAQPVPARAAAAAATDPHPHAHADARQPAGQPRGQRAAGLGHGARSSARGSNRYVDLKAGEQIPNGSSVDARKGRVTIVAAQSGTQARARGLLRRPVHGLPDHAG